MRIAVAASPPSFEEQAAADVDQLAGHLRTALQHRHQQPPASPAIDLSGGLPAIALSVQQARAVLRAIAPLALTTGSSRIRVGRLSTQVADALAAYAACGRGRAGNPLDLDRAIAATLALLDTLATAAASLRWREATGKAGTSWPSRTQNCP